MQNGYFKCAPDKMIYKNIIAKAIIILIFISLQKNLLYSICSKIIMTDANPIRFTLSNGTDVIVKKMTNTKYDFELRLTNGNRKTFVWDEIKPTDYDQKIITEAIAKFKSVLGTE